MRGPWPAAPAVAALLPTHSRPVQADSVFIGQDVAILPAERFDPATTSLVGRQFYRAAGERAVPKSASQDNVWRLANER